MTSLAERAANAVASTEAAPELPDYQPPIESGIQDLGDEFEPGEGDPDDVPVHVAWLRVRRDVRAIGKREKYDGGGTRFNFRGVDTVVNVFGPVTLKHGVNVIPTSVDATYRDTTSAKGSKMRECTVRVTWTIYGPKGDSFTAQSQGEALDSADKGTAKAQSVALRVLLLSGGLTPTSDPDPDSFHPDRGEAPARSAESYRDEIVNPQTPVQRLYAIGGEVDRLRIGGVKVMNETGDMETLQALGYRIYTERSGGTQ